MEASTGHLGSAVLELLELLPKESQGSSEISHQERGCPCFSGKRWQRDLHQDLGMIPGLWLTPSIPPATHKCSFELFRHVEKSCDQNISV